jgi:NADPH:quinone reductase-like Zn-dependent oxidoreductase
MRALVLHEVGSLLVVEDRPTPEPGPGEVLIRLHAAALNRRDFWIQQGLYADIRVPVILGSDGAGVVDRLGAGVAASWQGKEVIINPGLKWGDDPRVQSADFEILGMPRDGTFAEYVRVPVEQVWERPAHLNWEEAAALPLAGLTAYRALFTQGGLRSGERVLITGIGGGVATMALLFSVAVGAEVWVTSSSPAKIDRAVALGAAGGFLYTDRDWTEALLREAGNPHLIVDSAGGDGYRLLVDVAAPGGRIVNFGATRGNIREISPRQVFWKQLHLIGSTMGSPREFAAMVEFVGRQALKPVVDQVLSLEEANRALAAMSQSGQFGKLVLRTT